MKLTRYQKAFKESENIREFLTRNKSLIKVNNVEREANAPRGTLYMFMCENRGLVLKRMPEIIAVLERIGYKRLFD